MAKSKKTTTLNSTDQSHKALVSALGFTPKENTSGTWSKEYANSYRVEVDFDKERFNYGELIRFESTSTLNFSKPEHWVILECVDRLLVKGYSPRCITLEKTWKTGHGTSGKLDILVTRPDDDSAYMMIECKTNGAEFERAYGKLKRDGGQLFTYFQQDTNADVLILYASSLSNRGVVQHQNCIVKIEDDYRLAGNVKDFYERWNKLPKNNGVFDEWVSPYDFQSKALTPQSLKDIEEEHSSFIFNRFLEILRHNVVSDKPNAFNKIFTLFLCKIYDEKSKRRTEELDFQWLEGVDDHISFQKRLTDLYRKGMKEFLDKEVSDLSDKEFEEKFSLHLVNEDVRRSILAQFTELRLKKNNEFAIKEVFDETSFEENAKVVKDVVELLQGFKIRYTKRHQYLSDFFELLLTTGLKQESGQFFTPVPIAQFIIKSIPLDKIVKQKLIQGQTDNLLPCIIDYAAGSGHFLTESMHEVQRLLSKESPDGYLDATAKQIKKWQIDHFDWAIQYVYGIEKDYRLVKVGKVGCYLHGDGLAKVIHGDGLANFSTAKEYQGRLRNRDKFYPQDNKQFDIVLSNPPYSVAAFKGELRNVENDFDLYGDLTDQSSQIECLFIERTKQLLKDGGLAGVILPSSILTNSGIYTRTREIILQYFDIVAIVELGGSTFMATATNTVALFLRRRKNEVSVNVRLLTDRFFDHHNDVSIHGIEQPVTKYLAHVWPDISLDDYITLVKVKPNERVVKTELYQEYVAKVTAKTPAAFWAQVIGLEKEKFYYFVLAYQQKLVVVKSGEKDVERQFLGYEFSHRRGSEGIHATQRTKTIDECTLLFDADVFDNPEKASTYIYKAFQGEHDSAVHPTLTNHVSRRDLVDMLPFDRADFEKAISTIVKKKIAVETKWNTTKLGSVAKIIRGVTYAKADQTPQVTKNIILTAENITLTGEFELNKQIYLNPSVSLDTEKRLVANDIFICLSSGSKNHLGKVAFIKEETSYYSGGFMGIIRSHPNNNPKYIYYLLNGILRQIVRDTGSGSNINNLSRIVNDIDLPMPPIDVQNSIVAELEHLSSNEAELAETIRSLRESTQKIMDNISGDLERLRNITSKIGSGATPTGGESAYQKAGVTLIRSQNVHDDKFVTKGLAHISDHLAATLSNASVEKDDILLNITGASVCRCCMVDERVLPARVNQHVAIIRTNGKAIPKFVQQMLVSTRVKGDLMSLTESSSTREALTKAQLEDFKIPLPPLASQRRVVSEIGDLENRIIALEAELNEIPLKREAVLRSYL